jgi:hypothetical protein
MSIVARVVEKVELDIETEPGKKTKIVNIVYRAGELPLRSIYIDKDKLHPENVKALIAADLYQLLGVKLNVQVVGL